MPFQNEKANLHDESTSASMRSKAVAELVFKHVTASVIAQSLGPEIENPPTNRIKVDPLRADGNVLKFTIRADDTSALRAALNSYLRWICAIQRSLEVLDKYNNASPNVDV